jgi:DNA-binding NarL/FixJ family response regulator
MRRTVLVVSHNPKVRSELRSVRGPEVRVLETLTGLGALFLCACHAVDLLVVDLDTPGMDWQRLLDKLSDAFPEMPMLSAAECDAERIRETFDSPPRRKRPQPARAAAVACGADPRPAAAS